MSSDPALLDLEDDRLLRLCRECREQSMEAIRKQAHAAGIAVTDADIQRLILRPRAMKAYVVPPFDLEHYKRHL